MGMMQEFKEFAVKGNVMDLAVGVIIGGAFGKIVDSVVGDLIMPVVSKVFGGLDFTQYYIALAPIPPNVAHALADVKKAGVPVLAWGNFVNVGVNFVILAFIIFIMVKQINRMREQKPATPRRSGNRPVLPPRTHQRRHERPRRIQPRDHPFVGGGGGVVSDGRVAPVA